MVEVVIFGRGKAVNRPPFSVTRIATLTQNEVAEYLCGLLEHADFTHQDDFWNVAEDVLDAVTGSPAYDCMRALAGHMLDEHYRGERVIPERTRTLYRLLEYGH